MLADIRIYYFIYLIPLRQDAESIFNHSACPRQPIIEDPFLFS